MRSLTVKHWFEFIEFSHEEILKTFEIRQHIYPMDLSEHVQPTILVNPFCWIVFDLNVTTWTT